MQNFHNCAPFYVSAYYLILLPLVGCSFHEDMNHFSSHHKSNISDNFHKLSPQMTSDITIHGILLWASLGFLFPVGILIIRMSSREEPGSPRFKAFFYVHVILQILSVLLATAGAVMSIKKFENSFDNSHQRLGLALYVVIWVQVFIGFFRPKRGKKERVVWYMLHWILGTIISLVGIINVYTGLNAYNRKTSRSTTLWTILFTAEVSFIAFFYLFQDKWEYVQKQGVTLGDLPITLSNQEIPERFNQKEMLPEPCSKRNALMNLFD